MTIKRVLIIKTSSLGDVIHTLPALTDAAKMLPGVAFDWVVEKNFSPIPAWHPAVNRVIPIQLRKWRKSPLKAIWGGDWQRFYHDLTKHHYDVIIDAQGLLKSAVLSVLAKGNRYGLDSTCVRERYAAFFYTHRIFVPKNRHAVTRLRSLFAQIFNYPMVSDLPDYGIAQKFNHKPAKEAYVVFLHGTTWATKLWPERYWQDLAQRLVVHQLSVYLPWGNTQEKQRAENIARNHPNIHVLPQLELIELAQVLLQAKGVVAVDTGLGHLSAALAVPTLSLYGPTHPDLTGTLGLNQTHQAAQFSCAPCLQAVCRYPGNSFVKPACFEAISPDNVYKKMMDLFFSNISVK